MKLASIQSNKQNCSSEYIISLLELHLHYLLRLHGVVLNLLILTDKFNFTFFSLFSCDIRQTQEETRCNKGDHEDIVIRFVVIHTSEMDSYDVLNDDLLWRSSLVSHVYSVPEGKVNTLAGHGIGHSKQKKKSVYVHVS
jgi:hypothetical protein